MIQCIHTLVGSYLTEEALQPFRRYTEIQLMHKFLDELWLQLMCPIKHKFHTVTRADIKNFGNIKAVFKID